MIHQTLQLSSAPLTKVTRNMTLLSLSWLLIINTTSIQQCQSITLRSGSSLSFANRNLNLNIDNGNDNNSINVNSKSSKSIAFHLESILTIPRGGDTDDESYDEYDTDVDTDSDSDSDSDSDGEYDSDVDTDTDTDGGEYDTDTGTATETDEESEDEYEEEEGQDADLASSLMGKSGSGSAEVDVEYDVPLALSAVTDMGITLGMMVLCNKLDLTNAKIIKMARFAFIAYVVSVQLFLIYVRYRAHNTNDRTPITINNPLSNMLQNQLKSGGDMVKNMADSFLSNESTIMEYDLSQAKSMNNSLLFPMLMLWFLHFKMGQVQPLFFQTATGVKEFIMSPLFQVYVLGRNLERPFKNPKMEEMQKKQEELAEMQNGGVSDSSTDEKSDDDDDDDDDDDEATVVDDDTDDESDTESDTESDDYDDEYDEDDSESDEYDDEYDSEED